jgi:hypothetical protein
MSAEQEAEFINPPGDLIKAIVRGGNKNASALDPACLQRAECQRRSKIIPKGGVKLVHLR